MKQRLILCISREYGSGARLISQILGERLGINVYDKVLLEKVSKEHGLSEDAVAKVDEKPVGWFDMGFPRGIRNPYRDTYDALYYVLNDKVFYLQAETIKKLAEEGSCIIVGRAADEVLKDDPDMVSIFFHAERADRIKRIMEYEKIDFQEADRKIDKIDKSRQNYHDYYSSKKWGRCSTYDLSINTSEFNTDCIVEAILNLLDASCRMG